jgi:hypothetical protein
MVVMAMKNVEENLKHGCYGDEECRRTFKTGCYDGK